MLPGLQFEREIVEKINSGNLELPHKYVNQNLLAVHVCTKKYSPVYDKKINTKADIVLAISDTIFRMPTSYYIDENTANEYNLEIVPFTGISVKINEKVTTTIQKISPSPFQKIIAKHCLGAGASVYIGADKISRNENVIKGWGCSLNEFRSYFSEEMDISISRLDENLYIDIKNYSNKRINSIVNSSESIKKMFFTGEGLFSDFFVAPWKTYGSTILPNTTKKLSVTTGSGRNRGKYQLAFKLQKD